ncbi:hypothetical protein [Streptomyces sp. WMMB 322]|uniref:hypothetical protein n=1 Tax=Streptomyces sp. WMMB 322 TaxID=1286821 RepID=UPI0006E1D61E|nr:hypothetical protein [Streptomyces sp. WMMB 322]SCK15371.1 hypothetical protein H180DRAFT_01014 [Streptomyces sp. WMMB 322]
MAVFRLCLSDGGERVVEAGRAVRTDSGRILLEDTDSLGRWELLESFEPSRVAAVYRRGPAEGGVYTWVPRPDTGRWWSY